MIPLSRMQRRGTGRHLQAVLGWLGAALGLLVVGSVALAHSFDPALLDLRERAPGVFDIRLRLPIGTPGTLGLETDAVIPQLPAHCRWLERAAAEDLVSGRADCGAPGLRGAALAIAGLEGTRIDAIVRITWHDGDSVTGALQNGGVFLIPEAAPRLRRNGTATSTVFGGYLRLGIEHILFGFDHLLFVLGLMLLVGNWRMLLKTISAFTAAHSITLALSITGLVQVSPAPVEALIAVSVALLALELTRSAQDPPTLARRYPWLVAFIFGLLHGLGFAGALAQIGLPTDQVGLALLAFNLGVETGQLAFVAVMVAPVTAWKRFSWPAARLAPAYGIGAVATAWALERIQQLWMS